MKLTLALQFMDWLPWLSLLPIFGAFGHGKDCVVKLDDGAGSITAITSYLDDADLEQLLELAETTVFGSTSKTFVPGLRDNKGSCAGVWDAAIDAILSDDLGATTSRSFELHPQGTASGKVKYTLEVWITNYRAKLPLRDKGSFSFNWQGTGNITRGTN